MHRLRPKIGGLGGLACAATLLLSATPAMASTNNSRRPVTGPEVVYGVVYGKEANATAPRIPLRLWGWCAPPTRRSCRAAAATAGTSSTPGRAHGAGYREAAPRAASQPADLPGVIHPAGDVPRAGRAEHGRVRRGVRARRVADLLRRVRTAVHARPEEGHVRFRQQQAAQPRRRGQLAGQHRAHQAPLTQRSATSQAPRAAGEPGCTALIHGIIRQRAGRRLA